MLPITPEISIQQSITEQLNKKCNQNAILKGKSLKTLEIKALKLCSNYSNSQSSICFMVLPQCFSFKTVRFRTVLHVFAMFLSDCIVILLSATYTAPLKIHLPTITFYPLIFPLYFNFHSSKKLRNLP